jgi:GDPmannose 4,6-dehydratase
MLQQYTPDDYVIATGLLTTVRDFALAAYREVGIDLAFEGAGLSEVGFEKDNGKVLIRVNPHFYRPIEPERHVGNNSKAEQVLGWKPSTTANEVAAIMARAAYNSLDR